MMAAATLAEEMTGLLRWAAAARRELASGVLLDLSGFEERLAQFCTALQGHPDAAGLRPLIGRLQEELGLLSETVEARLAAIDRPDNTPHGA